MLTGRRAFAGEDVSDTLAAILRDEPDWSALPPATSLLVRTVVTRCLAKDRTARIPDISVVLFLLDDRMGPAVAAADGRRVRARVWPIATAVATIIAVTFAVAYFTRSPSDARTMRFAMSAPPDASLVVGLRPAAAAMISPEGSKLAFTAKDKTGVVKVWVRRLNDITAQPLSGTDEAMFPFWSPDSGSIAFLAGEELKRIEMIGGSTQTVCAAPRARGGAWHRDETIVFGGNNRPLYRVAASGGAPRPSRSLPRAS